MTRISELVERITGYARNGYLMAILLLGTFVALMPVQAQAQSPSSDTWKSIAIIGGSTVAGAYIGHRVAGRTGAYIGAAAGASAGYAIDRHRRQNGYYNNGYYGNNSGYYNNAPYQNDTYGYPNSGYQGSNRSWRDNRSVRNR